MLESSEYHNAARGAELELIEPKVCQRPNVAVFLNDEAQMEACRSATSIGLMASHHRGRTIIKTRLVDLTGGAGGRCPTVGIGRGLARRGGMTMKAVGIDMSIVLWLAVGWPG